jgi:hypothetical protein
VKLNINAAGQPEVLHTKSKLCVDRQSVSIKENYRGCNQTNLETLNKDQGEVALVERKIQEIQLVVGHHIPHGNHTYNNTN